MKIKTMLLIAAAATIVSTDTGKAQDTIKAEDTITVPPGRTIIEVAPGQPAVVETVPVAPSETVIVTEPAGTIGLTDRFRYEQEDIKELYPDHEMTIDLFASYTDAKEDVSDVFDDLDDGDWGGGIGVNYFFLRFLGIGADAYGHDNDGSFVDAANASLILRLPIDILHLAPYAFGGGGYNFQGVDSWTAHAGAGLELRLNRHTGIFVDGRYVWAEDKLLSDSALFRAGLRFAF